MDNSDDEFFSGDDFETPTDSPTKENTTPVTEGGNVLLNNVLLGIEENAAKEAMKQSRLDALSVIWYEI